MEFGTHSFLLEAVISWGRKESGVFFDWSKQAFGVSFHFQFQFYLNAYFYEIIWLCIDLEPTGYMLRALAHQLFDFPIDCNEVDKLYDKNIFHLSCSYIWNSFIAIEYQYIIFMQTRIIYRNIRWFCTHLVEVDRTYYFAIMLKS